MAIVIGKKHQDYVDEQVRRGLYASPGDVVETALGLLESRDADIDRLRAAIVEAEASGPAVAFDFDDFLQQKRRAFMGE